MCKNTMNIVAIIQARMSSTRLPKKVLLPLGKKTVIENVYDRVSRSKLINKVVLATTTDPSDDILSEFCQSKGMEVFRGSLDDVLDRYYQAGKHYKTDVIVRITGDCPLCDAEIIDRTVSKHIKDHNDFTATAYLGNETFADGLDVDVFDFSAIKTSWEKARLSYQREHVGQYITANAKDFKIGHIENSENLSSKRWTLDEPNDYEFLKAVYQGLGQESNDFNMKEILQYLKDHPELENLNHQIIRNEGLHKSAKKDNVNLVDNK